MRHTIGTTRATGASVAVLCGVLLSVALAGDAPNESAEGLARGWRLETGHQFREAHEAFERAGEGREARFGRALTLLNTQPKTRENIETAAHSLAALVDAEADDEWGIAARYFLGRIEQIHRYEPNLDKALDHYATLFESHSDQLYGQLALVKWGMIRLYDPANEEAARSALFDELEARGEQLDDPIARRSFHMLMADALCRFERSEARAVKHLLAVDELGVMTRMAEADLYVRIGELARLAGDAELARQYYQRMLQRFPRDTRAYMIRQRLEGLGGGGAEPPGGGA